MGLLALKLHPFPHVLRGPYNCKKAFSQPLTLVLANLELLNINLMKETFAILDYQTIHFLL